MSDDPSIRDLPAVRGDDEEVIATDTRVVEEFAHIGDDLAETKTPPLTWRPQHAENPALEVAHVEEVEWLMKTNALTALRQTRSFGHSVSLTFHGPELKFYVALYMDELLWRAVRSPDFEVAERAFDDFARQVKSRAVSEVRRVQLEAQNAKFADMIAEFETRAERLCFNVQRNTIQKQRAIDREKQLRHDITQLESTRTHAQLLADRTFRQIKQLYGTCAIDLPRDPLTLRGYRKK